MPKFLRLTLCFFFLVLLAFGSWFSYQRYRHHQVSASLLIPPGSPSQTFLIDKHTSATKLAYLLKEKHLFHSPTLFLEYIAWRGIAHQLKAGAYCIEPGESVSEFLDKVIKGDTLIETFAVIEGTTVSQVSTRLKNARFLNYQETDWNSLHYPEYPPNLPMPPNLPEGLLLTDTYHYRAGTDAKNLLQVANQHLLNYLNECWKNRASNLPYTTPYELLIAASIVERETALPEEKPLIASVIVNRLKRKMPLQMDPTVIYALGSRYEGKLKHADLSIDSFYNTYRYRGLPPTPIAMVGKAALDATAHPQQTHYLYFVAKGDGSHKFSVNYDQQRQAISEYARGQRRVLHMNEHLTPEDIQGVPYDDPR
ncbi:MAG: endolytic transglycosylase MltG [Legionella sp.]|nr:endolytic transglycosylase MltG [Legionella sp.]